ncbi:MAG: hypothetical protein BEN19_07575 [Epulopiscium sp. Nuni2H_MBin003]|nr:MAG: hypothetical protein BEN19_07575 [Epulopiscium sp. Nuni2H_MBin003]
MQYRKLAKNGPDISLLGYGCMRFPTKAGNIDKEKTLRQLKYAYDKGVNYYDTAYPYHAGKSEVILGEFINRNNIREKVYIADKLPTFLVSKPEQISKYFNTQLHRLNTTYIDFYLMHALSSIEDWEKFKKFGIVEFIEKKKKTGAIRYIGFSFHGRPEEFIKIIDDYDWDFCQIQYNYLDEHHQAGKAGLKYAYKKGIGVVVMEPLRGGSLAAKAPDKVKQILEDHHDKHSPAYWALRFVMNHKEVSTVLSGMNVLDHIKENIVVSNKTRPNSMGEADLAVIEEIKNVYKELMKVPCTGCNYCMPCPFGVAIPDIFNEYNSKYFFGDSIINKILYIGRSVGVIGGKKAGANQCTMCGKCVKKCPQHIKIPVKLKEAHKELDNAFLRSLLSVVAKIPKRSNKKKKA